MYDRTLEYLKLAGIRSIKGIICREQEADHRLRPPAQNQRSRLFVALHSVQELNRRPICHHFLK